MFKVKVPFPGRGTPTAYAPLRGRRLRSLRFYREIEERGRPDLAAQNAAVAGRLRLAVYFGKKAGWTARQAWELAYGQYRAAKI